MREQIVTAWGLALLCVLSLVARVAAEDAYYNVPIQELTLTCGKLPSNEPGRAPGFRWGMIEQLVPRVVLDGSGEAYVEGRSGQVTMGPVDWREGAVLAIQSTAGKEVTGRLFLPKDDLSGMVPLTFSVPAAAARPDARQAFLRAKFYNYDRLLASGAAGGAWFRHEQQAAKRELVDLGVKDLPIDRIMFSRSTREDAYALFSGGRAISENLQLDRAQPATRAPRRGKVQTQEVDIATIAGITVREMDWQQLIRDLKPSLDPLAASIPSDQHAIFLPGFSAALKLSDEANRVGVPVLQLTEPRSEDAGTIERYQRQLGISLDGAARLIGPQLINSLALTGSDPYFRIGTDVAVLMEAKDPPAVEKLIIARVAQTTRDVPDATTTPLKIEGISVTARRSPDRGVSSYVAVVGRSVVVTNSLAQLERLVSVYKGTTPAISSLPEYTFFRNRYPRGDAQETALLFLSDATIRRWCGPRWRIASARRTLAAALLADQQATHLDGLVRHELAAADLSDVAGALDLGQLRLTSDGVTSSIYGSIAFGTPIAELAVDKVTTVEKAGYERWRETYQQNWRQFFDPIAVRFEIKDDVLAADLTVMPLILGTEYRQFISVVQGTKIGPNAADPHDSLVHLAIAFNAKSEAARQARSFALSMAPGVKVDPFGWLGESIAVYVDDDPIWAELAKTKDSERSGFLTKNLGRLPVAVYAEVIDGLKLTAFLATLRAFVEQTVPGMIQWQTLTYNELPYVKVTPTAQTDNLGLGEQLAMYYYASSDAFIVSLNEEVLKRAIDRQIARRQAKAQGKEPRGGTWLGSSVALHVDGKLLAFLNSAGGSFLGADYQSIMQVEAWANLTILNAWMRRFPNQDPFVVHELLTGTRLVCPGGGKYVWNDQWQTMQSTVYGHPGEPKQGPPLPAALEPVRAADFGLTFEEHGLRARASIDRRPTSK
jgi:hypothetical protein